MLGIARASLRGRCEAFRDERTVRMVGISDASVKSAFFGLYIPEIGTSKVVLPVRPII